jgi:lysozyme
MQTWHYRKLNFNSRDHEKVSSEWFVLLWDIAHKDKVSFNVNEGHRTMARQAELVRELGLFNSQTNPHGAAAPSDHAPHIKTGHPDHAIDFDNAQGVIDAARRRGVTLRRTVSTESWHLEPDPGELHAYWKKNYKRVYAAAAGKKIKHPITRLVGAPPRRVSDKLLDMVASWEGERLKAYRVPGESFWTIGVGHTGHVNGKPIHEGMVISKATSRKLFRADLDVHEAAVKRLVPDRWLRRQRRYDTCVSLSFNLGPEILTAAPPLTSFGEVLKNGVNANTINAACDAIKLYNKGGSPLRVMPGLVKRRGAEATLFKTGQYIHNH